MLNNILTYRKQRVGFLKFFGLSLFLLFYALKWEQIKAGYWPLIVPVFILLFLFRLYDDLMQWKNDLSKDHRNYTDPQTRRSLIKFWIPAIILVSIGVMAFSTMTGMLLSAFVLLNHLLYLIFVRNRFMALILPLIKYPIFILLLIFYANGKDQIDHQLLISAVSVFIAFTAFESMDDALFDKDWRVTSLLQFSTFFVLFFSVDGWNASVACISLFILSLGLSLSGILNVQYYFLALLLILKIYLNNYGI